MELLFMFVVSPTGEWRTVVDDVLLMLQFNALVATDRRQKNGTHERQRTKVNPFDAIITHTIENHLLADVL